MNHPDNKHNEWAEEKQRKREDQKRAGTIVQGIVEYQMEIVKEENASLCPHRYSIHCTLNMECTSLKEQKLLDSTTSKK